MRHPFWFSASPTLGSRVQLRLLPVLEGWRCARALGRPRPPRSHPRRGAGANALAPGPCARPEKSKRAPLGPSRVRPLWPSHAPTVPAKSAGREIGSGKGQGASGRAHARLAQGPVFQHGANSASRLLALLCWSAPKGRPISAQSAARLCCGSRPAWPRLDRPRPLRALAGPGPPDPNREEAGSSQLPPLDWTVPLQSLQYPISIFSPFSAHLTRAYCCQAPCGKLGI